MGKRGSRLFALAWNPAFAGMTFFLRVARAETQAHSLRELRHGESDDGVSRTSPPGKQGVQALGARLDSRFRGNDEA